jgi:hypothetical protein
VTSAPPAAPERVETEPSTARLLIVLAIALVACAGLVLAGVFLVSGSSQPEAQGPALRVVTHELPVGEAPTITLSAVPDSAGGWNLHLDTSRFAWAPEHAGGAHVPGEGHAHVWVGDTKVGRAYGEWFYLPENLVPVGEQTVRVELNSNDHGIYAVPGGGPVAATLKVVSNAQTAGDGHHHQH